MDFLFELLFDLLAEGTFELSKCKKVPKCIRYLLIGIIVLFCAAVIGIVLLVGVAFLQQSILLGVLFIALALFMLILGIVKFKKTYLTRKRKDEIDL